MKLVIGLVGEPNVGKSSISNFFVKKGFVKKAFADKIKEEYYKNSKYNEEIFKSSRGTEIESEIRKGLWKYSDEKINKFGKLYFISPLIDEIKTSNSSVIISDIRTTCELKEIVKINGKIIYVWRERLLFKDGFITGTRIKFKEMKEVYYTEFMNNFNSLEETYKDLERLYEELIGE